MDSKSNPLANLANQVRQGKAGTDQRFVQEMGPQLERMVRRVIRFGAGCSPLEQKIDRVVELVTTNPDAPSVRDQDSIVGAVTHRLLQEVVGKLQDGLGLGRPLLQTKAFPSPRDVPTRAERNLAAVAT